MQGNIVKYVKKTFFGGSAARAASAFNVTLAAYRKWEGVYKEFPASSGRMQRAHELTGIDYKLLAPSIFRSSQAK